MIPDVQKLTCFSAEPWSASNSARSQMAAECLHVGSRLDLPVLRYEDPPRSDSGPLFPE